MGKKFEGKLNFFVLSCRIFWFSSQYEINLRGRLPVSAPKAEGTHVVRGTKDMAAAQGVLAAKQVSSLCADDVFWCC